MMFRRLKWWFQRTGGSCIYRPFRCPSCATPHIDRGEWRYRPHKRHLCETCGQVWDPFPAFTYSFGVEPAPPPEHRNPGSPGRNEGK